LKTKVVIGVLVSWCVIATSFYYVGRASKKPTVVQEVVLDTIYNNIETLKQQIDTIYSTKTLIKVKYEEKAQEIINQSSDSDWLYYTEFLRSKFSGDSLTIKAN
jgi:Na+-translocating ferredoxin:NAD+ oxidoreductase RnfD subunit